MTKDELLAMYANANSHVGVFFTAIAKSPLLLIGMGVYSIALVVLGYSVHS